jgi:hypothetical protein
MRDSSKLLGLLRYQCIMLVVPVILSIFFPPILPADINERGYKFVEMLLRVLILLSVITYLHCSEKVHVYAEKGLPISLSNQDWQLTHVDKEAMEHHCLVLVGWFQLAYIVFYLSYFLDYVDLQDEKYKLWFSIAASVSFAAMCIFEIMTTDCFMLLVRAGDVDLSDFCRHHSGTE